tara:strand:+ start:7832 stop:8446 length:615 start_codon:yes stop_codon:yes gene_type:complete
MADLKHIGRIKNSRRKVAVVFRTLPDDPDSCLVCQTETLRDEDHDLLIKLIESNAGQNAVELADAMQRTPLGDGSIMLARFHTAGHLTKISTADIEMTPNTTTTLSLNELNETIAQQKGVAVKDLAVGGSSIEEVGSVTDISKPAPKMATNDDATSTKEQALSDDDLANKMRKDADSLFKEATELRKQADKLSPSKKAGSRGKA